jgi:hypothetical protein
MHGIFAQKQVAAFAKLFLDGLLGNECCKTDRIRTEAAGDSGPWRRRAILVLKRGEIPGREIEEMVDRQLHGPRRQSADDRTRFLRKPYACPKTSTWHASL